MRWRRWIQPAYLVSLLAIAARVLPGPRVIDDAYITFRYARNLLAGNGLVFNPGEAVLGTTTPLYTLLMAVIGRLSGGVNAPFPTIALITNALADGLTCAMLILIGDSLGHRRAGIAAALVWAIAPMSVTFAIGGMETSAFIALATGTFYLYLTDRPVAASLCAGLSLVLHRRRILGRGGDSRGSAWLRCALAFAVPVVAWGIVGTILYGNPLPHSIAAKVQAYHLPSDAALIRLMQHFATPFLGHLTFGIPWIGIGLVLFPILFGLGSLMVMRERPETWALLVYPWIYFAAFAVANPLIFRWYLVPPLPVYFLGIFLGVERLTRDLRFRPLAPAVIVVALGLTLRGWVLRPDHGPTRPAPEMAYIQLELLYEHVADRLLPRLSPGDTIAAGDIGALGYYTQARILDTIGLISPVSLGYYPIPDDAYVINYAIPARLIDDQQPDWVVLLEVYGRETLLKDPQFLEAYRLTDELPSKIYGSKAMLVFQRRSPDE